MPTLNAITNDVFDTKVIAHGFFGRGGGVSKGIFSSLNCGPGSGDHPFAVIENRSRVADHFTISSQNLLSLYQIHSPNIIEVREPWTKETRPRADAMVTRVPGLALSILTADCGPVLLADPLAGVIGAAHAGWKGAFTGILDSTIDEMIGLGAARANIHAVLGPTISASAYEVGPEFFARFMDAARAHGKWFRPSTKPDHHMFDLPGFITGRLESLAIGSVENLDLCTYGFEDDFFSFRRTTHRKEADYGRNISVIMLKEPAA